VEPEKAQQLAEPLRAHLAAAGAGAVTITLAVPRPAAHRTFSRAATSRATYSHHRQLSAMRTVVPVLD
jgi:hypothetical protein